MNPSTKITKNLNFATHKVASNMSFTLAIAGIFGHGIFEILQGSTSTGGVLIKAVGPEQQQWEHGTEDAMTIIPKFLLTGLHVILVSLAIMVHAILYLDKTNGTKILASLFLLLVLFGGGIGQILFIPFALYASSKITGQLNDREDKQLHKLGLKIQKYWFGLTLAGSVSFLLGLLISTTGLFPVIDNPDTILYIDWVILLCGLVFWYLSILAALAHDSLKK